MSHLSDFEIAMLCERHQSDPAPPMVSPFVFKQQRFTKGRERGPSYGLSSYGYDVRLGSKFKYMRPGQIVDLRLLEDVEWEEVETETYKLYPGAAVLGHTMETFHFPDNILGTCYGKSTIARAFVQVIVTPAEPEWYGQLTLEIVNHSPCTVLLHAGDGICQIRFDKGIRPLVTYADRGGRYQGQIGPVTPT